MTADRIIVSHTIADVKIVTVNFIALVIVVTHVAIHAIAHVMIHARQNIITNKIVTNVTESGKWWRRRLREALLAVLDK